MVKDIDATWANAPTPADAPEYDAADLRRADTALVSGAGNLPLGVRGGIAMHSPDSLAVTVDGSDQMTVQPGAVIIPGDAVSGTGCYRSALPDAWSEALPARNATNGRIDLVVFRMLDTDVVGTHTQRRARLQVIPGTPSATPAVPAKPTMAVEIARINVPNAAGGAATVDLSFRTFAAALGGELLVATAARLPATASPWQRARALDTGREYLWDGTSWTGGWQAFVPTPAAGWTVTSARFLRHGPFVSDEVVVSRTGATLTASSNGNIVDVPVLAAGAIPAEARPDVGTYSTFVRNGTALGSWRIEPDGAANITDLYPTATIAAGDPVTLRAVYVAL